MSENGSKPRCTSKTKAGKPCRGTPIAATDFKTCVSHAPEAVKAELGFGGPENGAAGGRATRKPGAIELLREKVEADLEKWLAPIVEALQATKHVVVGNGPTAHVEEVPDIPTRLAAAREALDRAYGRPRQALEHTGADGGPIQTEELIPQDDDIHLAAARLITEAEAATAAAAGQD